MAAVRALRQASGALRRSPGLLVPIAALLAVSVLTVAAGATSPLPGSVHSVGLPVAYAAAVPFALGGAIAMADAALDREASLGTFLAGGLSNYPSVAAATLTVGGVSLAALVAGVWVSIVANFAAYGDVSGEGSDFLALGTALALAGLGTVAYLLFAVAVQFWGQAVVVEGLGPVGGLRRSVAVVRHNLAGTLAYSVVAGVLGVAFWGSVLVGSGAVVTVSLPAFPFGQTVVSVSVVAVGTCAGTVLAVYSVAFYRTVAP